MKTVLMICVLAFGVGVGCGDDEDAGQAPATDTAALTDTAAPADVATVEDAPADVATVEDATVEDATVEDATTDTASPGAAAPTGREATAGGGAWTVWVRGLDGPLTVGMNVTVEVSIRDAAGEPVLGASPAVAYIHVGMGHGGAKAPFLDEAGDGEYLVGDLLATMPGTWELSLGFGGGESVAWTVTVQ